MDELVDIQIPNDPQDLGGPYSLGKARILKLVENRGIAEMESIESEVELWLDEYDKVYFQQIRNSQAIKALRKPTDEDIKKFRVPIWIQSEEIPECCGRPMVFVGQMDDDVICTEPPQDAKYWWHDAASFYVFTCGQCLEVKAVGQQF